MGLADFCYRCPECGHDPMAGKGDRAWCGACGFRVQRTRGRIFATSPGAGPRREKARTLAEAAGAGLGDQVGDAFRYSAQATVCWRIREEPVWRRGELRGYSETMGAPALATVTVDREAVAIESVDARSSAPSDCRSGRWSLLELRAVQTSSSSLQLSLPGDQMVQLRFATDSPKRWEDMLRQLVREAYRRAGRGFVHEFQPRIATR